MWSPDNCHNFQSHQFSIVSWKHGLRPEVRSFARLTDLSAMKNERACAIFSDSVQVMVNNKPGCFYKTTELFLSPCTHNNLRPCACVTFACKFCTNQFPYFVQFQWFSIWIDFLKKVYNAQFHMICGSHSQLFHMMKQYQMAQCNVFFPTPFLFDAVAD